MSQSKARATLWKHINGATGAQVFTGGGTLGTGNVAFTAQPTAGDTISVSNVVFTFTAGASTATNINIKGTLALTLAEAETVIEAHPTVGVGSNVIVNVDVTNLDADLTFRFHPNLGAGLTFASSTDGANTTDTAYSAGNAAGVIDTSKSEVLLEWADQSGTLEYLVLPDGDVVGQMVEVYAVSVATSTDSVGLIGTFASANNLLTVGGATSFLATEGATLYWHGGVWKVKASNDAVASKMEGVAL